MPEESARVPASRDFESEFNYRLHADRSTIGAIIDRLGFTWDIFAPVSGANRKQRLSRVPPMPASRHAVYLAARQVLSADRIARAVRVPRQTILSSFKSSRRKNPQ